MRSNSILLIILLATIKSFSAYSQSDTILKQAYINIATLIVDFETYDFEGGSFSYYNKCYNCSNDSLPFIVDYHSPGDFGSIAFKILSTSDTVFEATIIWMGLGEILYPANFNTDQPFVPYSDTIQKPSDTEYFDHGGRKITNGDSYLIPKADSAWEAINSLEITKLFSEIDYKAGIYQYAPSVGAFDPAPAKWIVFLYYNDLSYSKVDMKTLKEQLNLYPNPCATTINFDFSEKEPENYKVEIIDLMGRIIMRYFNRSQNIDVSNLNAGIYIMKYSNTENSDMRMFVKE